MLLSARTARRAVAGAVGTGALAGAMLFGALPTAMAEEPANCTGGDRGVPAPGVSKAAPDYLFSHPDVNFFFTSLEGKTRDEVRAEVDKYMAGNPTAKGELTSTLQPL